MLGCEHAKGSAGGSGGGGQPVDLIEWDDVFAHVVDCTGWTWADTERDLDLHRLAALNRQWARQPPVAQMVAAYLGYKPPDVNTSAAPDDQDDTGAAWIPPGMQALNAPDSFKQAQTTDEALAALERHYFGEIKDVQQI